ncbi:MAG: sugar kinase [Planctomycetes bacterium]|nr:sugar kinase [Planctomycetota bacterium]
MRVVTLGEVMMRLMPPGWSRVTQSIPGTLESTFGGAEANVAVSIAAQGGQSAYCTALPDNPITDAFAREIRKFGVDDSLLIRTSEGRFGIYFVENGANQRGGTVIYDRAGSSISLTPPDKYPWDRVFDKATWFHISGITPAISKTAADVSLASVEEASKRNVTVSCDLNYRKKLWTWRPGTKQAALARETMERMLAHVDVVIANEEDADHVLGIRASGTNVDAGQLNLEGYEDVAKQVASKFSKVKKVAITLRESISASHNNWGAMLYDVATKKAHFSPTTEDGRYSPFQICDIVDRVGAGDAFAGGLIFALNTPALSESKSALSYAVAASCLKHSIRGDFNDSTRPEIEALMKGGGSGRVSR